MSKTSARVLGRFAQHLLLSNFFLFRSADLKKAEAKEVYSSSEDEFEFDDENDDDEEEQELQDSESDFSEEEEVRRVVGPLLLQLYSNSSLRSSVTSLLVVAAREEVHQEGQDR